MQPLLEPCKDCQQSRQALAAFVDDLQRWSSFTRLYHANEQMSPGALRVDCETCNNTGCVPTGDGNDLLHFLEVISLRSQKGGAS